MSLASRVAACALPVIVAFTSAVSPERADAQMFIMPPGCGPAAGLAEALESRNGQVPVWSGLRESTNVEPPRMPPPERLTQVFASETGVWAVFNTTPTGIACLSYAGQAALFDKDSVDALPEGEIDPAGPYSFRGLIMRRGTAYGALQITQDESGEWVSHYINNEGEAREIMQGHSAEFEPEPVKPPEGVLASFDMQG